MEGGPDSAQVHENVLNRPGEEGFPFKLSRL